MLTLWSQDKKKIKIKNKNKMTQSPVFRAYQAEPAQMRYNFQTWWWCTTNAEYLFQSLKVLLTGIRTDLIS